MGESEGSEFPPKKQQQQSENAYFQTKKLARQLDFTQGVLPDHTQSQPSPLQKPPLLVSPAAAQSQPQPHPQSQLQLQPQVAEIQVVPQQQTQQQQQPARAV
jgi:hypothetical protein